MASPISLLVPVLVVDITVAASSRSVPLELVGTMFYIPGSTGSVEAAGRPRSTDSRLHSGRRSAGPHERVWVPEHEIESGR